MALSRRGRKLVVVGGVVLAVALAIGVLALGGQGNPVTGLLGAVTRHSSPPPPTCPLTGRAPKGGTVPARPALAIKVENLPEARPQTGLDAADIVYEEPVEAGITRFIAVFQCTEAARVEPVRSGRLEDPDVLVQFGHPLFGYAGGVGAVIRKVRAMGLHDVNFEKAAAAYQRDPGRVAPHNLYTSTAALWRYAPRGEGAPKPVFTYSATRPSGAKGLAVHLPFSPYSDVMWKWSRHKHAYTRWYGTTPATLSDGSTIQATNVVVQVVKVTNTQITDVNGVPSPLAHVVGTGKVYVFRNGKVIVGKWVRPSVGDVTKLVDRSGATIALAPGNTWVELYPSTLHVTVNP
ncbi:MAG TPA: DUF3048 domain-containing protein [Actinomycetota bacterium]|jgi:hypothetical protein